MAKEVNTKKMNRKYKKMIGFILLSLLAVGLAGCVAVLHSERAHTVRIMDAATGKPVPGAVMIEVWGNWGYGMEGGNYKGPAKIIEAISDANGRIYFPSWGPSFVFTSYIVSTDPQIILYKPGYRLFVSDNDVFKCRKEECKGAKSLPNKIRLTRDADNKIAVSKNGKNLYQELRQQGIYGCDWEYLPRLLVVQVINKMEYFKKDKKPPILYVDGIWENDKRYRDFGCESSKDFISRSYAEYLKNRGRTVSLSGVHAKLQTLFDIGRDRGHTIILSPGNNAVLNAGALQRNKYQRKNHLTTTNQNTD